MGQAISNQHSAVVLRSHFNQLRALLAVALIGVIGLTVAVVVLANDDQQGSAGSTSPAPAMGRLDYGGFNPATGRPDSITLPRTHAGAASGTGPDESAVAGAITGR